MPMKIFKKGQKNRRGVFAFTGLALALLLTFTAHAASYNGYPTNDNSLLSEIKAKLHPGAGEQYVNGKIILDSGMDALDNVITYFDARGIDENGKSRPSFFQASRNVAYSVLASLYDFTVVDGPLFIGLPLGAFQSSLNGNGFDLNISTNPNDPTYLFGHTFTTGGVTGTSFSATLQKVNIVGAVRSSALAHQYSDLQRVCVNAEGVFTLDCPSTLQTYSCTGTLPTNATLCSGDDQGLAQDTDITLVSSCTNTQKCEAICNNGYHYDTNTQTCIADVNYEWKIGDWGGCSTAIEASCEGVWTTEGTGACTGDGYVCEGTDNSWNVNGLDYDCEYCDEQNDETTCNSFSESAYGSCTWNTNIENHSCSDSNPQSASECTQQNSACYWVDAQDSVRRRVVNCVDQSGTVVADSYCSETKPSDIESCVNGQCPDDDSLTYISPATCVKGTVSDVQENECPSDSGSNGRTWLCLGSNGGTNDSCATPTCFLPDTKVTMADGSLKNIQEVQIGEKVVGRNGEISPVLGIHRPSVKESAGGNKVYAFNGGRFFVTAEHPFLTTEGWKAIDPVISKEKHPEISSIAHLKVGDTLITDHGKVVINSITSKEVDPDTTVYNLILGGDHTYIADGYVVHNLKCEQ